jgi:cobalt/nickel transport system permease protein
MGFFAAALFVVSLIHFPIAGTSIHLSLFGLAGIVLGIRVFPVIFVALLFQSLIFQHGGLVTVGLNALNMGAGAMAGWLVWKTGGIPESIRAFAAGFFAVLLAAFLMVVEFQLTGYGRSAIFFAYIYSVAAIIEGMLTVTIVAFFRRVKPDILEPCS